MFDTVKVTLIDDGRSQTIELVPSLEAVELISERFGSFSNALNSTSSFDFNAIFNVFDAGIKRNRGQKHDPKELKKALYATGFASLMPDVVEFLTLCMNGGRKIEDDVNSDSKKKTQ